MVERERKFEENLKETVQVMKRERMLKHREIFFPMFFSSPYKRATSGGLRLNECECAIGGGCAERVVCSQGFCCETMK